MRTILGSKRIRWPGRPRTVGLAARLGLAISLLTAVVCVGQTCVVAHYYLDDMREQVTEKARVIIEYLSDGSGSHLVAGRFDGLRELAQQARIQSGVRYSRFFGRTGLLLVSEGTAPPGAPSARADGPAGMRGPIAVGSAIWQFEAPLFAPAPKGNVERVGAVAIGVSVEGIDAFRRRTLRMAIPFTAIFILTAVLAAMGLARAATGPVGALATAADRVASGDFGAHVEVRSQDEIGRLARSFNAMVDNLAQAAVLEREVRDLQELTQLKSQFLATVSHELRTPLNVILGYIDMLAEGAGGRLTEEQATMVASIRRYSLLQLDLITNVLDFSRLTSGKMSYRIERFALAPLLADIQSLHGPRPGNGAVALEVVVDPALPELETDRIKLHEIVRNLVDNAVKFTDAGSVIVSAGATGGGRTVVIEVSDTGKGIAPQDMATIFDAFRQVGRDDAPVAAGVGLGLSIVKQLVHGLGGTVSVASTLGEGSTFRVEIPCSLGATAVSNESALAVAERALDGVVRNAARQRDDRAPTTRADDDTRDRETGRVPH